jgi:hypothetical protein
VYAVVLKGGISDIFNTTTQRTVVQQLRMLFAMEITTSPSLAYMLIKLNVHMQDIVLALDIHNICCV